VSRGIRNVTIVLLGRDEEACGIRERIIVITCPGNYLAGGSLAPPHITINKATSPIRDLKGETTQTGINT
jgi:hypothetical protein